MDADVIWSGRGPLTYWPEVDWAIVLSDDTWQPIWTIQPRTSALLWARRMGARFCDPHDDRRSFLRTKPMLVDEDRQKKLQGTWAQVVKQSGMLAATKREPAITQVVAENVPDPVNGDAALRELAEAEATASLLGRTEAFTFCPTTNKVKHKSKLWALHHRNRIAMLPDELHPEQLAAYKCRWCGGWHVGHRAA